MTTSANQGKDSVSLSHAGKTAAFDMKIYRTAEIAAIIGVHPNTVRFYEAQGLLPPVPRSDNGYRIYSARHLLQLRLIRLGFRAEILSNHLRCEVIEIVKTSANLAFAEAIEKTKAYQTHIRGEMAGAREAISLTEQIIHGEEAAGSNMTVGRREAAGQIGVSIDVLRDWERNGLLHIPREGNRRQYGIREMNRLKIISILRHANYSQMAIRRMLERLDRGETDLLAAINTPEPSEDIISVADRYLTSLSGALQDAANMLDLLEIMRNKN